MEFQDLNIQRFVDHVIQVCKESEVELKIVDSVSVDASAAIPCGGYFDCDNHVLACATQDPNQDPNQPPRWVTLLAHEFGHLEQWKEDCDVWKSCYYKTFDCTTIIDMWLNHAVELNEEQLTHCINAVVDLELDCEKRAVEIIKKFNLPFDIGEYVQRANAYALHYQFVKKHRKWSIPGRGPSSLKEVYSTLSTEFDMDYHSPMSQDREKIFYASYI